MSESLYNFFDTSKYELNIPIYYFYAFVAGIFLFRVVETFLFKGDRSFSKYPTRTVFRFLMFFRMALKLVSILLEFNDKQYQNFYQCWMSFLYNCLLIISTVCLEKSFEKFLKIIGKELKLSPKLVNFFVFSYLIINTLFLLTYALALGKGSQSIAELLYTCFLVLVYAATIVFVNIPLIRILYHTYCNHYGSGFSVKLLIIIGFLVISCVFNVIASFIRIAYSITLFPTLLTFSNWGTAIFDCVISLAQTFIDYALDKIVPIFSSYVKTDDVSSGTAMASLPI